MQNGLLNTLGITVPIVQAPMAGASSVDLVVAVSEAGGLGSFGAASLPPDQVTTTVRAIKAQTTRPFNMNFFHRSTERPVGATTYPEPLYTLLQRFHDEVGLASPPELKNMFGPMDEQLDAALNAGTPIVSFHFGVDNDTVKHCHKHGARVLCSATTVAEAEFLQACDVDVIIAQGSEADGHRGTFLPSIGNPPLISTFSLVQALGHIHKPVIAAGGIMNGPGAAAIMSLGAAGVQMGTAFLGTPEIGIAEGWRQSLIDATAEDTVVTTAISGRPARAIRNRYISEVEKVSDTLPYSLHYSALRDLRAHATPRNITDFMVMWSGQGVDLFRVASAKEILEDVMAYLHEPAT